VIYFDYDSYQRSGLVGKGFALFSAPTVQLDEYPKLNKKRVSELFAEVRGQIEAKSGPHWERFRAVLAEKGKAVLERPSEGLVAVLAGVDGPIDRVQTLPVWGKIEADVGLKAEFYAWWAVRGGDTLVSDLVK
jgi:hypothetical protein